MKWKIVALVVFVLVAFFAWPTPYRYGCQTKWSDGRCAAEIRANRWTGTLSARYFERRDASAPVVPVGTGEWQVVSTLCRSGEAQIVNRNNSSSNCTPEDEITW